MAKRTSATQSPKKAGRAAKRTSVPTTPLSGQEKATGCRCGCGGHPKMASSTFLQGHDNRIDDSRPGFRYNGRPVKSIIDANAKTAFDAVSKARQEAKS